MRPFLQIAMRSFFSLVYPSLCLNCEEELMDAGRWLCDPCLESLDFLNPRERCRRCFSMSSGRMCPECLGKEDPFSGVGAAFEYAGSACALVKKMKYGNYFFLAKTLAAFLVTQWAALDWPMPDLVVPVPLSFDRKLQRGYNQSELIARQFAQMINRPCRNLLKRRFGDYSQAGLSYRQRMQFDPGGFQFFGKGIEDRTILLIDDVMTTGRTLEQCGTALIGGFPKSLYGLAVCKA